MPLVKVIGEQLRVFVEELRLIITGDALGVLLSDKLKAASAVAGLVSGALGASSSMPNAKIVLSNRDKIARFLAVFIGINLYI
jgi:hypothetical protein